MAYVALTNFADGDDVPGPDWWNQVGANFAASAPDIMTAAGQIAVASAENAASVLTAPTSSGLLLISDTSEALQMEWSAIPAAHAYWEGSADTASYTEGSYYQFDPMVAEAFDTTNSMSTSARYTAPLPGKYLVIAYATARWVSGAPAVNEMQAVALYINGSIYSVLDSDYMQGTPGYASVFGADIVDLVAGDYMDLYTYFGAAGDSVELGDGSNNGVDFFVQYLGA